MAIESFEKMTRSTASGPLPSGVPSFADLEREAAAEVQAGARDPVLGTYLPYRIEGRRPLLRGFLLDERDRAVFGDVVNPPLQGKVVGSGVRMGPEQKLEGYYQLQMDLSAEQAVGQRDWITESLAGMKVPPEKALEVFREAYRNGQINVQLADLGLAILKNQDTPATWAQIARLKKEVKGPYSPELLRWWEKMGTAAADQVPLMAETLKAAPAGAALGGAAGALAGATVSLSPTIGEEAVIPALTFGGMKLGAGLAGAYRIGQIEAGSAVLDLLDAGVDPAIAKAAAWGVGAVNGALEMTEMGLLLKTLPGGRMLGHKALSAAVNKLVKQGTLRNLAAQHAVRFGTYLSAETAQEIAQESVSITAEEFSKALTEQLSGFEGHYATVAEIKKRLAEIGVKSLQGFTVLGIPGSALSAGVDVVQQVRRPADLLLPDLRTTEIPARAEEIPTVGAENPKLATVPAAEEIGSGPSTSQAGGAASAGIAGPARPDLTAPQTDYLRKLLHGWYLQPDVLTVGELIDQERAAGELPGPILDRLAFWLEGVRTVEDSYTIAGMQSAVPELALEYERQVASVVERGIEAIAGQANQRLLPASPADLSGDLTPPAAEEKSTIRNPKSAMAGRPAPEVLDAALAGLSLESLKQKAKEIGIRVKGKKAQLAALISDAIKAKAGVAKKTRGERDELRATEQAIKDHPLYQEMERSGGYQEAPLEMGYEGRTRTGLVDPGRTYYVEEKYRGDVEGYTGQPMTKGYDKALADRITYDREKGQAWDQALQEQALEGGFDEFMRGLKAAVAAQRVGPGGINESVLAEANKSNDPFLRMLAEKRRLLRARHSAYDINAALDKIAAEYEGMTRADYADLLIAGGEIIDPADPHPGSMKFKDFLDRLGQELGKPEGDSAWLRQYTTGVAETPRLMHERLKAEWQAVKTQEIAAELNLGQILKPEKKLTAQQEAEIEAVDAEKVAQQILEREKQTIFGQLIRGVFDEAAELGRLRQALHQAYRAGAAEGIAKAKAAYAAQEAKVKARKELRERVAKMLRIIHRPVGRSVALAQRLAIQEIQATVDPQFRAARTIAERQAAREYFAQHPEEAPPARIMKIIGQKAYGELSVAEIEETARAIVALRRAGKAAQTAKVEARAAQQEVDIEAVVDALTGGQPLPADFTRPSLHEKQRGTGEAVRNLWLHTLTPERLFDWLDRQKNYLGDMFRIFWTQVADAEAVKQKWILARRKAAQQILKDLNLTVDDLTADALEINGQTASVQDVLGIYNHCLNLEAKMAIQFGNEIGPADQGRVADYVENQRPVLKQLSDWILEHGYDEHFNRLYEASAQAEDRSVQRVNNYSPMRRMEVDFTPHEESLRLEKMQRAYFKKGYAEKGFTISRAEIPPEYQKPIRVDSWTLLLEQIEREEHYIAFADLVRRLQRMLKEDRVRSALRSRGGRDVEDLVQHYVDAVGNPNIYRTYGLVGWFLRRMRQHTAIAYLGVKLSTTLKQPVSLARYLPYAGLNLAKAGLEYVANPAAIRQFVVERDPLIEAPALERELEELKQADRAGYEKIQSAVGRVGFKPIEWTDGVGRTIGWYGVYLQEMQEHGDEAKAIQQARLATSLSQAGARSFQLPELYRTNDYVNAVLQFTNELNKLWNIESYDLPMLLKNGHYEQAFKMFVGIGIEASVMWMLANRSVPDEPKDWLNLFATEFESSIPVLGPVLVAAQKGFGGGDLPIVEAPARAYAALKKLGAKAVTGDADEKMALQAAGKLYEAVAVGAGLPYTGPRDVVRTVATGELSHLLGAPMTKKSTTKAGMRAAAARHKGEK